MSTVIANDNKQHPLVPKILWLSEKLQSHGLNYNGVPFNPVTMREITNTSPKRIENLHWFLAFEWSIIQKQIRQRLDDIRKGIIKC
jgi:hypothetical protein